jgi:TPP-dependent pyruvate/acetoin dehydrogenase alpha subunit
VRVEPAPVTDAPPAALADDDLQLLLLIRHFETKLLALFEQGLLSGTTHTCIGQEYIPVALRTLLNLDDFVFSNHRGHGHYLARYQDPDGLLAEIMGRAGAVCGGVGGSQHILHESYLSTGVQGQSLPIAAGMALHLSRAGRGALACVHIGDGTWGEGAVYEALNLAALWRLPLLVVVEHNGIAQSTPTGLQMAGTIAGRAAAFGIPHRHVRGAEIDAIRAELAEPVARVRDGGGPLVVEFETLRVGPHSKGDDTRTAEQIRQVRADDWLSRYTAAYPGHVARCAAGVRDRIDRLAAEITARPPAGGDQPCG